MQQDPNQIRTTRLQCWEDFPGLEAAWSNLLDRSPHHSVFQTFPWHACWWRAFRGSHELFLVLAHRGSELVGIAPLMVTREKSLLGRMRRRLRFIGSLNGASDYCDFITDPAVPQALRALLREMDAGAPGFDRIDLAQVPVLSPNRTGILDHFEGRGAMLAVEFQADAPVRVLGDSAADRKAANKSSLKRHTRFFEKTGELRFRECASEGEILEYLDAFFDQHKARRGQTDSPSQFLDPAQRDFYRDLVKEAFRHGWIRFDVVLFNGAPLAFHFGFEYRRRFIWYKPTFDIRLASRSPGEVLIKHLLDGAIGKGLEEFDFGVGSEPFKLRFANRTRSNDRIIVFHSAADYWMHRGGAMLKELLGRGAVAAGGGKEELTT